VPRAPVVGQQSQDVDRARRGWGQELPDTPVIEPRPFESENTQSGCSEPRCGYAASYSRSDDGNVEIAEAHF
jgi:hypothetical protein